MSSSSKFSHFFFHKKTSRKTYALFSPCHVYLWCWVLIFLFPLQAEGDFIRIGETIFEVEIADTDVKRTTGLSGRKHLSEHKGMLFVYPSLQNVSFWMKGMLFSIDLLWIRKGTVIAISPSLPYPTTKNQSLPLYVSPGPIDAVLEIRAGIAKKRNIKVGNTLEFLPEQNF